MTVLHMEVAVIIDGHEVPAGREDVKAPHPPTYKGGTYLSMVGDFHEIGQPKTECSWKSNVLAH
jgi:hypothetical protein